MLALIIANGDVDPATVVSDRSQYDLIVAADGGSDHCQQLNLRPHTLIGDLDSISQLLLEKWKEQGVEIIRHPQRKDKTDLEIALEYAQEKGAEEIHVFGALGERLDMTLANVLLLAHPSLTCKIKLFREKERVTLAIPDETMSLKGKKGDAVSLIPLVPETSGITTHGLEYPLQDGVLEFGTSRGVSNVMTTNQASISVREGILCVIHTMQTEN